VTRWFARTLAAFVVAGALVALVLAALLVWAVPYEQVTLVIDGERIVLPALDAAHWVAIAIGLWIALAIALAVLPLVFVLGIGLPLLVVGIVGAALLAPLLALGLLVWWLARRDRKTIAR
jgi:hypothetical protein